MKVIVTGATGFIGTYLVKALMNDYDLALILRDAEKESKFRHNNIRNIYGSLENIDKIKEEIIQFAPDACIYLAWDGIPDFSAKKSQYNVNLAISFLDTLLETTNCREFIVAGSCYEYGNASGICKENDVITINSYISWAKHSINQYLNIRCKEVGAKLHWLRCFYVYGYGQRREAIIPSIIWAFLTNEKPVIKTPFNANDFIHVKDIATGINNILELKPETGIYNLGSGKATQIVEVCEIIEGKICNSSQFSDSLRNLDKPLNYKSFFADVSKAKDAFGWEPQIDIESGIEELIQEYKSTRI